MSRPCCISSKQVGRGQVEGRGLGVEGGGGGGGGGEEVSKVFVVFYTPHMQSLMVFKPL